MLNFTVMFIVLVLSNMTAIYIMSRILRPDARTPKPNKPKKRLRILEQYDDHYETTEQPVTETE